MIKKPKNTHISFPDQYLDPRDFHEAIIRTALEAKKLLLPKVAKKHNGKYGIAYFAAQDNSLDIRFLSAYLQILLYGYDGLCIIQIDYHKDFFERKELVGLEIISEFANTSLISFTTQGSFLNGDLKLKPNSRAEKAISTAQVLYDIQKISVLQVGCLRPKDMQPHSLEFLQMDELMTFIHKKSNCAILVIGEQEREFESEYNATRVYQTLCTMMERSIKTISCDSAIGELHLFIA